MTAAIYLVKGREKSVKRKHPWIFSRGINKVEGEPALGETVDVFTHDGKWLAKAAYSPASQIRARIWSFDKEEIDTAFFVKRLKDAQLLREDIIERDGLTGYRLIAAESDAYQALRSTVTKISLCANFSVLAQNTISRLLLTLWLSASLIVMCTSALTWPFVKKKV